SQHLRRGPGGAKCPAEARRRECTRGYLASQVISREGQVPGIPSVPQSSRSFLEKWRGDAGRGGLLATPRGSRARGRHACAGRPTRLACAAERGWAVAVLDVQMPEMDGV